MLTRCSTLKFSPTSAARAKVSRRHGLPLLASVIQLLLRQVRTSSAATTRWRLTISVSCYARHHLARARPQCGLVLAGFEEPMPEDSMLNPMDDQLPADPSPGLGELSQVADEVATQSSQSQSARSSEVTKAGWSKRTYKMLHVLDKQFDEAADEEMLGDNSSRKTAASTFFELLVLKCTGVINVDQQEAFGSIMVTKTVRSQSPRLPDTGLIVADSRCSSQDDFDAEAARLRSS